MPSTDPRLKTWRRRKLVTQLRQQRRPQCEHPHCLMPNTPIDYDNVTSPAYFEVDEIIPRALGGDPESAYNVRATHRRCNRAAGASIASQRGRTRPAPLPLDAGDW